MRKVTHERENKRSMAFHIKHTFIFSAICMFSNMFKYQKG